MARAFGHNLGAVYACACRSSGVLFETFSLHFPPNSDVLGCAKVRVAEVCVCVCVCVCACVCCDCVVRVRCLVKLLPFELAGPQRQPSRFPLQIKAFEKISYEVQTSLNGKSARSVSFSANSNANGFMLND
jgi:hypothetical protein